MYPVRRSGVNKRKSARKFRRNVGKTRMVNLSVTPNRGGFRL